MTVYIWGIATGICISFFAGLFAIVAIVRDGERAKHNDKF